MSDEADKSKPVAEVTRLRTPKPCPICQKSSRQAFHPFCSARCANIDLNRWLNGAYAIPVKPEEESEDEDDYYGDKEF